MLKFTRKTDYAVQALLHMAAREGAGLVSAREIAACHGIPVQLTAKLLQAMARAGLCESSLGPRGGYRLAKPAGAVTLKAIIEAVEGGTANSEGLAAARLCGYSAPLAAVQAELATRFAALTLVELAGHGEAAHGAEGAAAIDPPPGASCHRRAPRACGHASSTSTIRRPRPWTRGCARRWRPTKTSASATPPAASTASAGKRRRPSSTRERRWPHSSAPRPARSSSRAAPPSPTTSRSRAPPRPTRERGRHLVTCATEHPSGARSARGAGAAGLGSHRARRRRWSVFRQSFPSATLILVSD